MYRKTYVYAKRTTSIDYKGNPVNSEFAIRIDERRGSSGVRTNKAVNGQTYTYVTPTSYFRCIGIGATSEYTFHSSNNDSVTGVVGYQPGITYSEDNKGTLANAQLKLREVALDLTMLSKDLVEGTELCAEYFRRLSRSMRSLRRGKIQKALNEFLGNTSKRRAVASNWLEFQWGVLPTIQSCQDAFKKCAGSKPMFRIHAHSSKTQNSNTTVANLFPWRPNYTTSGKVKIKTKIAASCYRYFTYNDCKPLTILDLQSPVPAIWDAIPWSFLLDWFIPIGDYLSANLSVSKLASSGCDTVTVRTKYTIEASERSPYWRPEEYIEVSPFSCDRIYVERKLNASLTPNAYDLRALVNNSSFGLSARRAINAFALLNQRI